MEKRVFYSIISFLFLVSFVSAESPKESGLYIRSLFQDVISLIGNFIFGEGGVSFLEVVSAIFLFLIFFLVFYMIFNTLFNNKNKFFSILLSIIIPLVILKLMSRETLAVVLLPYGVMGAVMLLLLPFFVLVYFSAKSKSAYLRKTIWIVFFVFHGSLLFYEYFNGNIRLIYLFGTIIGLLMIFFSSNVRSWFLKEKGEMLRDAIDLRTRVRVEKIKAENEEMGLE